MTFSCCRTSFWDCHVQHGDGPYNLYGDCFLPNALIRMANRETVKVKDLDYLGQPRVLSMGTTVKLTPGTIHISEAACKVNSYCNFKNATVRIVHLSGGRPPLVLGNEASIGVYPRVSPSQPGLTKKDSDWILKKGSEVSVLNSNLVCFYHSFSAVALLGFLLIILGGKSLSSGAVLKSNEGPESQTETEGGVFVEKVARKPSSTLLCSFGFARFTHTKQK